MALDRRGFLQGVFGGVTATGLIVVAKPEDIEAFSSPLLRDSPVLVDRCVAKAASIGERLYNERGECVAIVREITYNTPPVDMTAWAASAHVTLMADVIGKVGPQGTFQRLRGR